MRLALATAVLLIFALPAQAARVCVEKVGDVCLKYEDRPDAPATRSVSAEERAERSLSLSRTERRAIQRILRDEGHYSGALDGLFGPGSRRAIRGWQGARGTSADAPP